MDLLNIKKIDGHVHILPDDVHRANPDSGDWSYAKLDNYLNIMNKYNIDKALIMPLNDPFIMSMEFNVDSVNKNLKYFKDKYKDKFYAFADIDVRNSTNESIEYLNKAIFDKYFDLLSKVNFTIKELEDIFYNNLTCLLNWR